MNVLQPWLEAPKDVRVLALVAHGDDEAIGCGGLLARFSAGGAQVQVHIACLGDRLRAEEARHACEALGAELDSDSVPERAICTDECRLRLNQRYTEVIKAVRPHIVITHDPVYDGNRDHRVLAEAALDAIEFATHGVDGWTGCALALSFEIHALFPFPAMIVDVTSTWDRAVAAMAAYRSQIDAPHKRNYYPELMEARSRLRGLQGGFERGEAYNLQPVPVTGNFHRSAE